MQRNLLISVCVLISVIFATHALAQTYPYPSSTYPYPRTGTTQAHPSPSMYPTPQITGHDYPKYPPPNTNAYGFTEGKPGTTSGYTYPRPQSYPSGYKTETGIRSTSTSSTSAYIQQRCLAIQKDLTSQAQKGSDSLIKTYQTLISIFTGVQNYYTTKLIPQGISLQNYSSLVSQVQASRSAVLNNIQTAQNDLKAFSCTGGYPGQQISKFRQDMVTAVMSIKSLRDSIKNFVYAIYTAAKSANDTINTTATTSAK